MLMNTKKRKQRPEKYPAKELQATYKELARLMRKELQVMSECQQRVMLLRHTAKQHKCGEATVRNKIPMLKHYTLTRKWL